LFICTGQGLQSGASLWQLRGDHRLLQHRRKITGKFAEGAGQITHVIHHLLQLLLQAFDLSRIALGRRDQWLVFLLTAFKIALCLLEQGLLLLLIAQKLLFALFVARALHALLLTHRFQQLIEIGYLLCNRRCLRHFLRGLLLRHAVQRQH